MKGTPDITAVILAGGRSSRMGVDKGLLLFQGHPLIYFVLEALSQITSKILIITNQPGYDQFGFPCIPDIYPDKGPLGGIFTGLTNADTEKILVLGCDMPFITPVLLAELVAAAGDEDVLFCYHRQMAEPLCAVYNTKASTHIRSCLEKNQLKITEALAGLNTRVISFDDRDWFTGNEFRNMNSPDDLEKNGP